MCAYLKMCSLLQIICVQYCIVVAYVVEIKLNSIQISICLWKYSFVWSQRYISSLKNWR